MAVFWWACHKNKIFLKPEEIWPEGWAKMTSNQRKAAIKRWAIEKPKRDLARAKGGIGTTIPSGELEDYHLTLSQCRERLKPPAAPLMPILLESTADAVPLHREKIPGHISPMLPFLADGSTEDVVHHYVMVHQQ